MLSRSSLFLKPAICLSKTMYYPLTFQYKTIQSWWPWVGYSSENPAKYSASGPDRRAVFSRNLIFPAAFPNLWIPAGTTILMLQPAHPGRAQSSFTSDLKACKFLKNIIHSATFLKSVFCRSDSCFFRQHFRTKIKHNQAGRDEIHPSEGTACPGTSGSRQHPVPESIYPDIPKKSIVQS